MITIETAPLLHFCQWFVGLNGAMIGGVSVFLAVHNLKGEAVIRSPREIGWALLSHTILIGICVATTIFDVAHPGVQFPLWLRLSLTIPALLFSDFSLWRLVNTWDLGVKGAEKAEQ